jgi:hypothetical protein
MAATPFVMFGVRVSWSCHNPAALAKCPVSKNLLALTALIRVVLEQEQCDIFTAELLVISAFSLTNLIEQIVLNII